MLPRCYLTGFWTPENGFISLEDLATIPNPKNTSDLLDCLEIKLSDHCEYEDAEQLPSDGMEDCLAEHMCGSSLQCNRYMM